MAANEHIFRGDLGEVGLPQMLATIHRHRVPGVVECARRSDRKQIYFLDGDVIFATSSDREESLGEYLLMKGRISRSQLDVASREIGRFPGRRLGGFFAPRIACCFGCNHHHPGTHDNHSQTFASVGDGGTYA